MSHDAIWSGSYKPQTVIGLAEQVSPHLAQSEQIEVIDQERRNQHQSPTKSEQRAQHEPSRRVFNRPDHTTQWLPQRKQQNQSDAGEKHVSGAYNRLRYDPCSPIFEPSECYHSALYV